MRSAFGRFLKILLYLEQKVYCLSLYRHYIDLPCTDTVVIILPYRVQTLYYLNLYTTVYRHYIALPLTLFCLTVYGHYTGLPCTDNNIVLQCTDIKFSSYVQTELPWTDFILLNPVQIYTCLTLFNSLLPPLVQTLKTLSCLTLIRHCIAYFVDAALLKLVQTLHGLTWYRHYIT